MPYDAGNLHAVMAGNGDPYTSLTPLRMRLLRAMRDVHGVSELSTALNLPADQVRAEVAPLVAASLATERDGEWKPTCLVVSETETERVVEHARAVGNEMAATLAERRDAIEGDYKRMTVAAEHVLADMAFMLVGDHILDVGLLDACARDGSQMLPAPPRPSPHVLDARYYFWIIEGDAEHVGRYGQRTTMLPLAHWRLLTFGEYQVNGVRNTVRETLEAEVRSVSEAEPMMRAEVLAKRLGIAAINRDDGRHWRHAAARYAEGLAAIYRRHDDSLRRQYSELKASAFSPFGEFFCWYDHVAYSFAIDRLAGDGLITIPAERFQAVLWHDDHKGEF